MVFEAWPAADARLAPALGDLDLARRQLGEAALVGDDQQLLRRRAIDFCQQRPDSLYRSCGPGHLTGSGVVVDPAIDRVLLIHHAKLGRWLQPGGHADGDGNLAGVAWREATEETGLTGLVLVSPAVDIDIHTIPAVAGEPQHLHIDLRFVVLGEAGEALSPNEETLGARWLGADDPVVTSASGELGRMVARALKLARRFA
jgi:8-oxo-dGTP pyrophosphatase MutT (NUDIX family)